MRAVFEVIHVHAVQHAGSSLNNIPIIVSTTTMTEPLLLKFYKEGSFKLPLNDFIAYLIVSILNNIDSSKL